MMAKVKVLVDGYFDWISDNKLKASSNVVLIQDSGKNIIVDTGNRVVKDKIIKSLKEENLTPEDIDIVVNTHSHSDHRDNNNIFPNATVYVYQNTIKDDIYDFFPVVKSIQIAPQTKVIQATGHTDEDLTVIVDTDDGVYGVVGDLFKNEDEDVDFCTDETKLKESQIKVRALSDFIIPGHGKTFKVEE
jgi:glyoxylase-like metal-dependent hydrolase (beta-lactamase superfamily II)